MCIARIAWCVFLFSAACAFSVYAPKSIADVASVEEAASTPDPAIVATARQFHARALELSTGGDYARAIQLDERALSLVRTAFGSKHPYTAYLLDSLSALYARQQQFDTALDYSREAASIMEQAKGPESIEHATMLRQQASVWALRGDYGKAVSIFEFAYRIVESRKGANTDLGAQLARDIGTSRIELSQFDSALEWFTKALSANRALHGEDSADAALSYLDLSEAYLDAERLDAAKNSALTAQRILNGLPRVPAEYRARLDLMFAQIDIAKSLLGSAKVRLDDAMKLIESSRNPDPGLRALVLYKAGWINLLRRQSVEAERAYTTTLEIYRGILGENNPMIGRVTHCLAIVYQDLGQFESSEAYYLKAIDIFNAWPGEYDASVAATSLEYSLLLSEGGLFDQSVRRARDALAIYARQPGKWDLQRGYALANLALAQRRADNFADAEQNYRQALSLMTRVRGAASSDLPPGLTDLAGIYRQQHRFGEAAQLLDQAIAIRRKDGASTPAGLAESLSERSSLELAQGKTAEALTASRESVQIAQRRLKVEQETTSDSMIGEERRGRRIFERYLEAAAANQPVANDALLREMFEVAQMPHLSTTADAIGLMAARGANDGTLSQLVRARQDAVEQQRALSRTVVDSLTQMHLVDIGPANEEQDRATLAQLNATIAQMDDTLRTQYPHYAELTNPDTVSVGKVQSVLGADEALLLQVTSENATYVFLVTRNGLDFASTTMNAHQLHEAVESIREEMEAPEGGGTTTRPQFDTESAYFLYKNLFYPFADRLTHVRRIVAIVDRWMQSVPFSVLLTEPAVHTPSTAADYRSLAFFVRRFSFSIEPSVSAYMSLRSAATTSQARQPFIGFGDPVLTGEGTAAPGALNDALATKVDPTVLRTKLEPLPDTRRELIEIAGLLHADQRSLYFGEDVRKPVVMHVDLSQFRIISFATHALVAGSFEGLAEPALVLTPPVVATPDDNGLLEASDIATLKLDADWVLLSACNTAAPEGRVGAEGLSGLAKAFFYAGSRALLVSHWTVNSSATVRLMTRTIKILTTTPGIARAEALRLAMLSMLDDEHDTEFVHPKYWAPFFNVGDGGQIE